MDVSKIRTTSARLQQQLQALPKHPEWWPIAQGILLFCSISLITLLSQKLYHLRLHRQPPPQTKIERNPLSKFDLQAKTISGDLNFGLSKNKKTVTLSVNRGNTSVSFATALDNARIEYGATESRFISQEDGTIISYQAIENGLKEKIILPQPAASNQFVSQLEITRLKAYYLDQTIVFKDQNEAYQFHLEKPYAFDSAGNYTYAVSYKIVEFDPKAELDLAMEEAIDNRLILKQVEDQWRVNLLASNQQLATGSKQKKYQLITIVDQDWLNSPDRQYPITIDPTVVHDTTSEFASGEFAGGLDTGSGSAPVLESYYQELTADENTVGLWHMNEASGTSVADSSGNSYTGTAANTTVVAGKLGNARSFNGSSSAVAQASGSNANVIGDITIEAWINPTSFSTAPAIIHKNSQFSIATDSSGNVSWADSSNWSYANFGYTNIGLTTGSWQHLAITKTGSSVSIYLNGVLKSQKIFGSSITGTTNYLHFGCYSTTTSCTGSYYSGLIDEVRISNVARSSEEIAEAASRPPAAIYTSPVIDLTQNATTWNSLSWTELGVTTGDAETSYSSTNLLAQWQLNESSGTTADNAQGTAAYDLTLSGFDSTASQDADPDSGWTANNRRWGTGALQFDGVNSYAYCTEANCGGTSNLDFANDASFSYGAWFRSVGNASNNTSIMDKKDNSGVGAGYDLKLLTTGKIRCHIADGTTGAGAASITSVDDNQWHFVVCASDASNNYIYVDGRLEGTSSLSALGSYDSSSDFQLGRDAANTYYTRAIIDNAFVYGRTLSASEILANYNSSNIQLQTRVGSDASPDDGSGWEAWVPTSTETSIDSLDNILSKDLVSFWKLDEGSGTRKDARSVNNLSANGTGGVSSTTGLIKNAATFVSASSQYLGCAESACGGTSGNGLDADANQSITYAAWMKSTTTGTYKTVISKTNSDTGPGYYLRFNSSNQANCRIADGTNNVAVASTATITDGNWHHVACVVDRANQLLIQYVDGVAKSTSTSSIGSLDSTIDFQIGTRNGANYLNGSVDEAAFWRKALTANEIAVLYNSGKPNTHPDETEYLNLSQTGIFSSSDTTIKNEGSASQKIMSGITQTDGYTVGLWHLDETNGDLASDDVFDSSGYGHHGEFSGTNLASAVADGITGKARSFNGSDDLITMTTTSALKPANVTLEAWVKATSTDTGGATVASMGDDYQLRISTAGVPSFIIYRASAWDTVSATGINVLDNKWHHLAGVFNDTSNVYQIYVDGILITSTANTYSISYAHGANFVIGRHGNAGTTYDFLGTIDKVRVSNVALNAEEIAESYRQGTNKYLNKTLASVDLSSKNVLPFWVASDRVGTFLEATIGESAYANGLADSNTVALWRFDEHTNNACDDGNDDACDASGNGNDGDESGGAGIVTGKVGLARSFDGSDDYLLVTNSTSLQLTGDATFEGWVKADLPLSDRGAIFFKHYNNEYEVILETTGGLSYYHGDGSYEEMTEPSAYIKDNQWTHFAITRDNTGKVLKWYIDGEYRGSDTYTENPASSTNNVYIGRRADGTRKFIGLMDELRLSNSVRSADEIRQTYERGLRSHQITIEFGAVLDSANLISSTSDTSFTIDATVRGLNQKGDRLYTGDKIIVKENVGGTEYVAQGTVTAVTASTGAVTVAAWDSGSTAPSGGFTVNADVFKWQREYFPIEGGFLDGHKDAVTNLTLRWLNGHEGRTVWLDDLRSLSSYLTTPGGSTITSSTGNRYFQYRAIFTSTNQQVSSLLSAVTLDYLSNLAPDAPVFEAAYLHDNLKLADTTPEVRFSAGDNEDDDLVYEINWDTDADFASATSKVSDTDAGFADITTPADTSPFGADDVIGYTWQSALTNGATYFYRVRAKDPSGSNTFGDWSATRSFTIDTSLINNAWFQTHADQFATDTLTDTFPNNLSNTLELAYTSIDNADSTSAWFSTDSLILKIMGETSLKTEGTGSIKLSFDPYGNGTDGALAPTGEFNLNTTATGSRSYADGIAYKVASNPTGTSIVTSDTPNGLATGDEILLINLQGASGDVADVGNYELLRVASVDTGSKTITTNSTIVNSYDGSSFASQKVLVQRVPNYTDVTLDSSDSITASAWDGLATTPTGAVGYYSGIVAFKANGTVSVGSGTSITVAGKGYAASSTYRAGGEAICGASGGNGGVWPSLPGSNGVCGGGGGGGAYGYSGSSAGGTGSAGAGGGGGNASGTNASRGGAGGGGGYGGDGSGGAGYASGASPGSGGAGMGTNNPPYGTGYALAGGGGGGATYGSADLSKIYFGTAGGHGGEGSGTPGAGGKGGGIILIGAKTLSISGGISANGAAGSNGAGSGSLFNSGAGGGGAGGSIKIVGNSLTLGTTLVTATGGSGGAGTYSYAGGAGGVGRIRVENFSSSSGTSSPAASAITAQAVANKTISATNLSSTSFLKLSARASLTGSLMQLQMGESSASEQTHDISLSTADTWTDDSWDVSGITGTSRDAITKLAFKVTGTGNSFNFYFDDLGYSGSSGTALSTALTAANIRSSATYWGMFSKNDNQSSGTALTYQVLYDDAGTPTLVPDSALTGNSTGFTAADTNISALTVTDYPILYLKANFTGSTALPILYDWGLDLQVSPATPTITSASLIYPNLSFAMSSTDADGDYLQYKTTICEDSLLQRACTVYDQTSSQTGWTGQDANSNTAYASGTSASFSTTNNLKYGTTYYYKVSVIDPDGANRWIDSTSGSATTNFAPTPPTGLLTEGQTDPIGVTDLTPEFSAVYQDPDSGDHATEYQLQVSTYRNFYDILWDSGEVSISNLAVGTRSSDISYSGPALSYNGNTYFWRIRFFDSQSITGAWSNNAQFTMNQLTNPTNCLLERNLSTNQILITWDDNNPIKDSFTIQRSVNGAAFANLVTDLSSSLREYLDTTATLNNKYQYRIAVVSGASTGDWCLTPILDPYSNQFNFSGIDMDGIDLR